MLGVVVGVRTNSTRRIREVQERLPYAHRHHRICRVGRLYSFCFNDREIRSGVRRYHTLYADSGILARTEDAAAILDEFERDLNSYIAQSSPKRFFVHAGVVAWHGEAIVMPGKSYTGKTTLVKAFLQQGATYYSDEYATLDGNGYVHPYPRPLMIRGHIDGRQLKLPARKLGCKVGQKPIRIGLILLTFYRPSSRWKPRALSVTHGALGMLGNSFSGRTEPVRALSVIGKAVSNTEVLKGVRGEASDVVRAVLHGLTRRNGTGRQKGDRAGR